MRENIEDRLCLLAPIVKPGIFSGQCKYLLGKRLDQLPAPVRVPCAIVLRLAVVAPCYDALHRLSACVTVFIIHSLKVSPSALA